MKVSLRVSVIAKLSFVEQNILQLRFWWHKSRKSESMKDFLDYCKSGISSSNDEHDSQSFLRALVLSSLCYKLSMGGV